MRTIIFAHGMYMTGKSWDRWASFFEEKGYRTITPSWPGREGHPSQLRAHPPKRLSQLTLSEVLDMYRECIEACDTLPIIIGHSMGGLIAQLLLQEKVVQAAVAINSAPPQGVMSFSWSFLRSNIGVFFPGNKPIKPTKKQWRYAFAHTLPSEDVNAAYQNYVVPESRLVGKESTTAVAKINFLQQRPPLLMVAGELDHIIPASLNRKNYKKYLQGPSKTDYLEFKDRTHWICMMDGWQEVAQSVADWLEENT